MNNVRSNSSRSALVGACFFALSGCYGHSYPISQRFIASEAGPNHVELFADSNGSFYPSDWYPLLGRPRSWRAHSLLRHSPALRDKVRRDEPRQLADLAAFARDRKRIFILVHGYNNRVDEAAPAYSAIERKLGLTRDDGIVRFYWDGLTATGAGSGRIWFWATGNSQMAGARGLRRVLNQFQDKDVYIISHSRGASVVLSALGNPVYNPIFLNDTRTVAREVGEGPDFVAPQLLLDAGNRLHILLLAPAIDRIDFCDASEQPSENGPYRCRKLRPLGQQVVSVRYTVNRLDPVLRKFVGLEAKFNPTGLGSRRAVGCELQQSGYSNLRDYEMTPQSFHAFGQYVASPTFDRMLADEGLRPSAKSLIWTTSCGLPPR